MNEKVIRDNTALEEAERRIAATPKNKAKARSKSKGKGKGKTKGPIVAEQGYQPPPEPPQPMPPPMAPAPKPKVQPRRSQSAAPLRATTAILPTIQERANSVPPHYQMDQGEPMETWEHEDEEPWEELEEQQ